MKLQNSQLGNHAYISLSTGCYMLAAELGWVESTHYRWFQRRSSKPMSSLVQNTQPFQPITWLRLTELNIPNIYCSWTWIYWTEMYAHSRHINGFSASSESKGSKQYCRSNISHKLSLVSLSFSWQQSTWQRQQNDRHLSRVNLWPTSEVGSIKGITASCHPN